VFIIRCFNVTIVYEIKSQMIAELTGHISDATVQIKNDGSMLCRAISSLLKRSRTCVQESGGRFEPLL
jgi:hypothetical protein